MDDCERKFMQLLSGFGDICTLFKDLQQTSEPLAHVRQMLANFAPATLERYLACVESFLALHSSDGSCTAQVSSAVLADYMFASQSPLKQHKEKHRTTPITAIKALRWYSKQCIRAYSKCTAIKDVRESIPMPMALTAAWEQAVCDRKAFSQSVRLFLGTALLCTHGSIRFGDIQRTSWSSLQLSTAGLHGVCTATKTTKRGQPFAVTCTAFQDEALLLHGSSTGSASSQSSRNSAALQTP